MALAVVGILGRRLQPRAGQLPTIQTVRHASKAVTRHFRVMHFERQKLMALTQYIPPKPAIPTCCLPPPPKPVSEESGLTQLLKREVTEVFRKNRMIAVCQNVALSAEDKLLVKHQLRKHNIFVKVFPNSILRPFLTESKYQNLLPLFVGHNMLLVSSEPKAKEMLRVLRSMPVLPLLGGCIDDTILSYQGFLNYSKLPSQSLMQGELVGGLSFLTAQTHSLLQRQPLQLSALLEQYLRQQQGEGSTVSSPAEPASPDLVTDT
ncbi:39S ribosomal protein L10, mitochondrial isoform X1 [Sarcophilus harrisii]|uniref:Large ribosomal subunit protein uL10m n=1 Tax=Sarcophilus harrisii TaxID=9305 RepID=A0A7N4NLV4_SARHA|nr:39S ribosomal protein L10, mitochondrial isoform X1 [Sarcophilus harrisii]